MSAPYSANDVRNILEAFVSDYLVDIPAAGVTEREVNLYYGGSGDGIPTTFRDLLFSENTLVNHIFLEGEDEWFQQIADLATEAAE